MSEPLPLRYRPGREADLPFVFSSWLKSYHQNGGDVRYVGDEAYMSGQHAVIELLLGSSLLWVATPEDDDEAIVGWLCGGGGVLHYVYVKRTFRRFGVARSLLDAAGLIGAPVTVTHMTRAIHEWRGKGLPYSYDPYLIGRIQ